MFDGSMAAADGHSSPPEPAPAPGEAVAFPMPSARAKHAPATGVTMPADSQRERRGDTPLHGCAADVRSQTPDTL
jgi:hypothetical protein